MTRSSACGLGVLLSGLVSVFANAQSVAQKPSIAVLDMVAKVGIDKGRADVFAELVQEHLRNKLQLRVIGRSDIEAMLGLEKMKDMLACQDSSACMAEIGGALGVDELLVGSLAKMGSYLVVSVKRVSPRQARVIGQVARKLKGATDDDLIEAVGPMLEELFQVDEARRKEQAQAALAAAQRTAQAEKDQETRQQEQVRQREEADRLAKEQQAAAARKVEDAKRAEEMAKSAEEMRQATERAQKAEQQALLATEAARRAEQQMKKAQQEAEQRNAAAATETPTAKAPPVDKGTVPTAEIHVALFGVQDMGGVTASKFGFAAPVPSNPGYGVGELRVSAATGVELLFAYHLTDHHRLVAALSHTSLTLRTDQTPLGHRDVASGQMLTAALGYELSLRWWDRLCPFAGVLVGAQTLDISSGDLTLGWTTAPGTYALLFEPEIGLRLELPYHLLVEAFARISPAFGHSALPLLAFGAAVGGYL